jgi:flagellar protein FliT
MEPHKPADILRTYEHLAEMTARMRAAATSEDWDKVVALESECAPLYTQLKAVENGVAGDAAYQRRKSQLICQLLDDDAQIRERVSGQLARVWRLIDGRATVNRLSSAYGASGAEYR